MPKTKTIVIAAVVVMLVLAAYYYSQSPAANPPAPIPLVRRGPRGENVIVNQTGREISGYDFVEDPRGLAVYS